ncbi:hypothetical protein JYA63_07195 [Fictibacillus nanhaiensis]|uniref:Uncharacterized protein n=1 Tax=Fictibacillus nanhaiensis TaxID=742169 RepID=A0ABS2ZN07_9BACL|nr:hypothetical protein [Fictibacillus nanhaiensis]
MYTVLLILSILTLGFLIFRRTTRYKWVVLSILPLLPSLTFVVTEFKQNAFWLRFLETGSFVLSIISLPVILYIMIGFFFIYTVCFLCLFGQYMLLNKPKKR